MVRWYSCFREFIGELSSTNTLTNGEPVRTNWYAVPRRVNKLCDYASTCVIASTTCMLVLKRKL